MAARRARSDWKQNLGTSTDGTAWVNAVNDTRPLASLSIATTGATRYYSVSDERDPVRRTYTSTGTAGDTSQQSHYGEYELINGAAPVFSFYGPRGTKQSEVFPVRSLTFTENDVVLPAERGNLEYAGLALVYEGNRVKSALLGRDLNPLGRGDTSFYPVGALSLENATPKGTQYVWTGNGNSVNNEDQGGIGSSPNGNFDAAQMLKCNQGLHPDRLCPLCPLLKINPCQWTTPDELCECIRQAACEAYQCWYNNPYCCENVYRFCSCMCGKTTDCLVSGCGDTSGVSREGSGPQCCNGNGNGGGNGASSGSSGGGGGGCGGGGCGGGGAPGGNGGGSQRMPGGTGSGDQGGSQSTGQDKLKECEDAWDAAVDKLCNCITDPHKHPEIAGDATYGRHIAECCKNRPAREARKSGWLWKYPFSPCKDPNRIAVVGPGNIPCHIWVCCPNFLESTTLYSEVGGKVAVSEPNDQDCMRLTVVAIKFWQCCSAPFHVFFPSASADVAQAIHGLIHCCCDTATPQEDLGGSPGSGF